MPQLLGLVLIGAGAFAGFKVAQRAFGRMSAEVDRAAREAAEHRARTQAPDGMKDIGALEFDSVSGVYRPKKH